MVLNNPGTAPDKSFDRCHIDLGSGWARVVQGNWHVVVDTTGNQVPNGFFVNGTPANHDEVEYVINAYPGNYHANLYCAKDDTCGKLELWIGGVLIDTKDMYAAVGAYNVNQDWGTFAVTTSGPTTLNLRVNGKNAGSSGYAAFLNYLEIWRA